MFTQIIPYQHLFKYKYTKQEEDLQAILTQKLDKFLPSKTVRFRNTDKPYITNDIKFLDRKGSENIKSTVNLKSIYSLIRVKKTNYRLQM